MSWTVRGSSILFLERLHEFLQEHDDCRADKAINILSTWECLTLPDQWKAHVDLIELLLTFVQKPKYLLKAVTQVRDDKECRNQKFFSLLIRHIRCYDADIAEAEESLVTAEWPSEGDMKEADRVDAEMDLQMEEADQCEDDDEDYDLSSESSSDSEDAEDVLFECHIKRDLMQWMQDRTEASTSADHRCPAGEARKDYEDWVSKSAFPRQRVGKQEFAKYLERGYPKVAENGHRFFTGLVLKAAFHRTQSYH